MSDIMLFKSCLTSLQKEKHQVSCKALNSYCVLASEYCIRSGAGMETQDLEKYIPMHRSSLKAQSLCNFVIID